MKISLNFVLIALISTGCMGNNSNNNPKSAVTSPNVTQTNLKVSKMQGQQNDDSIESVDVYQLNYDLRENPQKLSTKNICSLNNGYCANLPNDTIGGAYAAGYIPGVNNWLIDEVAAEITISFNQNIDNGFRVSDAGIMLAANSEPVGKLISLDTSDCDNMVLAGHTQGKSCKIAFIYKALQTNNIAQVIHVKFTTNSLDSLDFPIVVQNYYNTNQKIPIINDVNNTNLFFEAPQIINNTIFFNNNIDNQFELKNVGTKDLISSGAHTPTINVKLSNKHGENFQSMFYLNNLVTNIGDGALLANKSTFFPFSYTFYKDSNNAITSPFGRFVYSYNMGQQTVNYIKSFILSNGVIEPLDIHANYNGGSFSLTRENLDLGLDEDDLLVYAPNLNNFRLSVVYNPQVAVDISSVRLPYVEYSIGDYNNGLTPAQIADKISFNFNPDCLERGFDVAQNNDDLMGRSCEVSVKYNGNPYADMGYKKPFTGLLVASYDSPVGNYPIKQIIGKITIDAGSTPPGNFTATCKNYGMDGSLQFHASCKDNAGNYTDSSLNYLDCTRKNTPIVSNVDGVLQCTM